MLFLLRRRGALFEKIQIAEESRKDTDSRKDTATTRQPKKIENIHFPVGREEAFLLSDMDRRVSTTSSLRIH